MIFDNLIKLSFQVYRKFGYESKEGIKVRQIIDNFISDSNDFISKTNNEYIQILKKWSLK